MTVGLSEDVIAGVNGVLAPAWTRRNGQVVPESQDINLASGAVDLDATYLYADMADSTGLAQSYRDYAVAKVIRSYLNAASRIIRAKGGHIRSFDGDRVMGIFIGDDKESRAAQAALHISWAVAEVIDPALKKKWDDFHWTMNHGVGIDTGPAMLVRGGVHGTNDIVSIGSAPNVAAKLSEIRAASSVNITSNVYDRLSDVVKMSSQGQNMWRHNGTVRLGGARVSYYGSSWWWCP